MTMPRSGAAALLAILLATVSFTGAHAIGCTADAFLLKVAAVPNLQTSATLLGGVLAIMGGPPTNSTVFLPTDAAWAAFKKVNGKSAPDQNRTVAIFLYNSIIGMGKLNSAALAAASPIQTSAGIVQSYYAMKDVFISVTATAATNGTAATVTSMDGETVTLGKRYNFCDAFSYAADKVLLPAADYASTPSSYISDLAELNARVAPVAVFPPPPASATPAKTPAPPPAAASGTSAAAGSAFALASGLAGAAALLLA